MGSGSRLLLNQSTQSSVAIAAFTLAVKRYRLQSYPTYRGAIYRDREGRRGDLR